MKKFTNKTILDYISGNDIEGFTLEELEDNIDFMKSVINYTNDKNMVSMCSKRVQESPEFVKFIIYKFQNDLDFICRIADEFLKLRKKKEEDYEIAIIMNELTKDSPEDIHNKYAIIASVTFLWEMETVAQCKAMYNNPNVTVGAGFIFIENDDANSPIMINYYAKRLINHIFLYYAINLEDILHGQFPTARELEKASINTFLINLIGTYDNALANYIKNHIELLDTLKEEIKMIVQNWDAYSEKKERRTFNLLFEALQEYRYAHPDCPFTEDELLYSIGEELGITDKIKKYDITSASLGLPDPITPKEQRDFTENSHYYAVKKLMRDIISGNYIPEDFKEKKKRNAKRKIINIDFSVQKKG